ncbi:hypothetical protein SELMODRAFT_428422 [Selaginella moellendorffii]|uniref:TMEM205-like domain-containing protein n=1 Tax=Selaginella moellendorffii TaxID=88036 RepID=D8T2S0_SELML|nr:uncharacterized protein LOC9629886 [Selaginella moellendorffii]EFJ08974.1 hypothetical protein SELMODRAFT_428422 [Selaginella moellendorffii]|eukprot:XP_002989961.1 uncharacterized protein LOC9629886 [Selaginella moellendorffii]
MMNVRALCVLLSSLGAVMFLSPEPTVRKMNKDVIVVEAHSVSATNKLAEEDYSGKLLSAAKRGQDAASEARDRLSDYVSEGASRGAESAASARDRLGESLSSAGDVAHQAVEEQQSLGSKLARAVTERVQEAAHYQPNLGQGIGFYDASHGTPEDQDLKKLEDYLEGARSSARDAMDKATEGLGLLRNQLPELEPHEEHPSLEMARGKVRDYYDVTKAAVLDALSNKEQQLGRSLDSSKRRVEAYYDKAKQASLESLENQKEKLGHIVDVVRLKLNAGREAVFNYGMSTIQSGKDAVVDEKNKLCLKVHEAEEEAARWGNSAREKVNRTWNQAGAWAHDKMAKLNQSEEMALRICKQWVHKSVATFVRLMHLFLFSSTFGSALWVTFISGFVLSNNISRHQFALVQSKIFPVYFRIVGSGIALLLATHILLHSPPGAHLSELLQCYNLAGCLVVTLLNTFLLEPRLTKCVFDKVRIEKEEGRALDPGPGERGGGSGVDDHARRTQLGDVMTRVRALHFCSSAANLAMLVGLAWHLWYLNCRLGI